MTYRGHIHNGTVVLDDPVNLPEGCKVQCELTAIDGPRTVNVNGQPGMYSDLMEFAGSAKGTPPDGSRNHDHYLYETTDK